MQNTNTKTDIVPQPAGSITSEQVAANDINCAFWAALTSLEGIKGKVQEFAQKCSWAGELLSKKNVELGSTKAALTGWLSENCPDISYVTASRLIAINNRSLELSVSDGKLPLTEGISSVRALYEELTNPSERPSLTPLKDTSPPPSKLQAALSRFWGAIKSRPPEQWVNEERQEFLRDLAERERLRIKQGWELPCIE